MEWRPENQHWERGVGWVPLDSLIAWWNWYLYAHGKGEGTDRWSDVQKGRRDCYPVYRSWPFTPRAAQIWSYAKHKWGEPDSLRFHLGRPFNVWMVRYGDQIFHVHPHEVPPLRTMKRRTYSYWEL
jgi:hypothetical protein